MEKSAEGDALHSLCEYNHEFREWTNSSIPDSLRHPVCLYGHLGHSRGSDHRNSSTHRSICGAYCGYRVKERVFIGEYRFSLSNIFFVFSSITFLFLFSVLRGLGIAFQSAPQNSLIADFVPSRRGVA